jgi:hypothetical protein
MEQGPTGPKLNLIEPGHAARTCQVANDGHGEGDGDGNGRECPAKTGDIPLAHDMRCALNAHHEQVRGTISH